MDSPRESQRVHDYTIAAVLAELVYVEAEAAKPPNAPPPVFVEVPVPVDRVANLVNRPQIVAFIESRAGGLLLSFIQHAYWWIRNRFPRRAPPVAVAVEPETAEASPVEAAPVEIPVSPPRPGHVLLEDTAFDAAILQARPKILIDVTPTSRQPGARGGIPRLVAEFARAGVQTGLALPVVMREGELHSYYRHPDLDGPITVGPGDTYVIIDIYWYFLDEYLASVRRVRAAGGRIALFVHDIFPIRFPSFYPPEVPPTFLFGLRTFLAEADACFTISHCVKQELLAYLDTIDFPQRRRIAFDVVYLAAPDRPQVQGVVRPEFERIFASDRVFLSVGTLEPRKGYPVTLDACELAWKQGVDFSLVIIGRYGWRALALRDRLVLHPELGRRLFWFDDANDAELYHAYARCRSLVQASIDEGFGLPLVEAALADSAILASDLAVFHEIGGSGMVYFPTADASALAEALTETLSVPRRVVQIPTRRWTDTLHALDDRLHRLPAAAPEAAPSSDALPRIHAACCFDDTMAMPACVVAASAEAATTDAHVTFTMLHPPGISIDIAALKQALDSERFEIVDCIVSESLTDLYKTDQYTEAMYYRFLLPDVVDAPRVIYLDSDTLVRRSLLELYTVDLGKHPMAAAVDHGFTHHMRGNKMPVTYEGSYTSIDEYCLQVLQFDLSTTQYFNNGVLVIDLERWREAGLSQRCIAFCRANPGLGMADQDAANHVLQGDFARLDTRWNAVSYLLREYYPESGTERPPIFGGFEENFRNPVGEWHEILMQWAYDPWIVHFAYLSKPWKPDQRRTGYEVEYWTQARRTPFGDELHERFLAGG